MKHYESGRQAVVVIHGIGNQRPMATLRDLIYNISGKDQKFFSSPNRITDDLEMRRLSIAGKRTDFYEYYWASFINDPTTSELISWIFRLVFQKKPSERLRIVIPVLRIISILILSAFILFMYKNRATLSSSFFETTAIGFLIILFIRFIWPIIGALLTNTVIQYIGDAMRYLTPSPQSVESRAKIRKGGLDLLRKLHGLRSDSDPEKPRYDRIVVVAHSLGSVIAYDILSYLWSECNAEIKKAVDDNLLKQEALKNINEYVSEGKIDLATFQNLQHELFPEQNKLGINWRISDFVTLGCPLTHVSLLITRNEEEFNKRKEQREFPTCPPVIDEDEEAFSYNKTFHFKNGDTEKIRTIRVLHHAAHFAMTKWTNMYFSNDFVGGKLRKNFGDGIEDIPLKANGWANRNLPLWSHTLYWNKAQKQSFEKLREILDMDYSS